MSPLSRRTLLGGVAAGTSLLAGCAALPTFGGGCGSGYYLDVTRLTDAELAETVTTEPRREHEPTASRLLDTAANEGEATYATYRGSPLQDDVYVEREGTYYHLTREVTATRDLEAREVRIEYDREESPPDDATVVEHSELPEADREAFLGVYPTTKTEQGEFPQAFTIRDDHVYPEDPDSQLVGAGTVWVRYEDRPFAVTVGETVTVEEETFRYTLEEVATDREAFVAFVREQFVVELDDLSEAEREVFERAIGESVDECDPLSEGFGGLVDRLEAVPDERRLGESTWLVTRAGDTYEVDLQEFVA